MATNMNVIAFHGNLTKDAEKSTSQKGASIIRFTVAVNRKRGEQDAQRKAADKKIDGGKVDLPRADHLVDGKTVQDGPHEHETDVKNTEHKRADHIPFIRTDVVKKALCETFFQSLPVHAVLSCESHISLYSSHEAYSSSCVPRPTIFPSSIAKMMSAFFMEDARWEMRMVVTSLSDAMFARTFASVAKSSAEQLSSYVPEDTPVLAVVSSLPLMNFSSSLRDAILHQMREVIGTRGCIIQFTYALLGTSPYTRDGFRRDMRRFIPRNLPPAKVERFWL